MWQGAAERIAVNATCEGGSYSQGTRARVYSMAEGLKCTSWSRGNVLWSGWLVCVVTWERGGA